jgi:protein subunit release factor B
MSEKTLLFSVTKDDLNIQFFRAGGKGGQHQNKTSSACRVVHKDSGAVGECREHRHQHQNKKVAFRRMVDSKEFQGWLKLETAARLQGYANLEKQIDASMKEENLKVEYYTP